MVAHCSPDQKVGTALSDQTGPQPPIGQFSSPEDLIREVANGRMIIVVDDAGPDSVGDLVVPGQMATPDAINFMARHGRGLICLAITPKRAEQLGLGLMAPSGLERQTPAFTTSIEAREGVDTGISAGDRARTVAVAIDSASGISDIVTPGHVFPVIARDGGVLVRSGRTEAAIDLARLAGVNPSAVTCTVMDPTGAVANLETLFELAAKHKLAIGSVRDLIAFRRRHDHLVERIATSALESQYGGRWQILTFRNKVDNSKSYALLKGSIEGASDTLVRVHHSSLFGDMLGAPGPRAMMLQSAMAAIAENGCGVIVLFPSTDDEIEGVRPWDTAPAEDHELRTYGIGAQILADLGVRSMTLLSNSPERVIHGLHAYGLEISGHRSLPPFGGR